MNSDEVASFNQVFQRGEGDTHLAGSNRLNVGVKTNNGRPKTCESFSDKGPDAAQTNNADRLFKKFDTRKG